MRAVPADRPLVTHAAGRAADWHVLRLWHFATEYMLALPAGAAIALVWANLRPESYFITSYAMAFFVNDVAMALFFGWVTKEVVEATLPGGILHSWRRALVPAVVALGVAIVPTLIYGVAIRALGEPMLEMAWPVTLGTDLAFAYFAGRIIFGRHAAVPFLLVVVLAVNGLGFVALGAFGLDRDVHLGLAALMALAAGTSAAALRAWRVVSFWPYVLGCGGLSWGALYFGGLHPAFALLPVVAVLPHGKRDPGFFVDASPEAPDSLSRFERWCRHPAQIALFLFGLVNAGVPLRALEIGAIALPIATAAGKPIGMLLGAALSLGLGLQLPRQLGWRELIVCGVICGTGFSLALFFATATLGIGQVLSETRMGALLSLVSVPVAFGVARRLGVGRFAR